MTPRWLTTLCLCVALAVTGSHASPPVATVTAYGPQYSQSDDLLKQILDELKGLRQDVKALKAAPGAQQDGALGVIATRCLACHQDGTAEDKGGGFVMVEKDAKLAELSLAEKRRITRLVSQGKMPPSGKLPDGELKQLTEFFAPKTEEKQK